MHDSTPMSEVASTSSFARRDVFLLAARWLGGLGAFVLAMLFVASTFRGPLEGLGRSFVARFGYAGMGLGTFIADGFHFPIPPQFYMLVAVSSGASNVHALVAIAIGSLLGGSVGFFAARKLARFSIVSKRLERSTKFVERAFERFGYGAALLASLSPLPYSVLCAIAGAHQVGWRIFTLISLCRLPRLCFFYWIVYASWAAT
jgi:membrane protein YqaA with SNARE-associated domain